LEFPFENSPTKMLLYDKMSDSESRTLFEG